MSSPSPNLPSAFTFTAAELRAACRLVDPQWNAPDEWYEDVASAPAESPYLLPVRVGVALTVVSERLRRIADATWNDAEFRAQYLADQALLERVARGEAEPPGFGS
jgi:hypothetical protein